MSWLLAPRTGEVFDNLKHCNRCLRTRAFVEGFDIVRNGGGTVASPSYRFRCIVHGKAAVLKEEDLALHELYLESMLLLSTH